MATELQLSTFRGRSSTGDGQRSGDRHRSSAVHRPTATARLHAVGVRQVTRQEGCHVQPW